MKPTLLFSILTSILVCGAVQAQIVVPNGDFESSAGYSDYGSGGQGIYGSEDGGNSVPDWNFTVTGDASFYGDFAQSATNHFGFNNINDGGATATWTTTGTLTLAGLPALFTPDTTYTLTLLAGGPTSGSASDSSFNYPASIAANLIGYTTSSTAAGNQVLSSTTSPYSATYIATHEDSNGFTPISFSFTTPTVTTLVGENIAIQLVETGGNGSTQTHIDNVALAIPEPGTWAMMIVGALGLAGLTYFRPLRV